MILHVPRLLDRFLRDVRYDTPSDEQHRCPRFSHNLWDSLRDFLKGGLSMRQLIGILTLMVLSTFAVHADVSTKEKARIRDAAAVLKAIHAVPDKDIPQELWARAACVLVVPSLKKAAFVIGGEYGKGLMSCRRDGDWTPPVFMEVGKGSWGLQIGAQSIDLVLLVMNSGGMEKLLRNKVSLGAEASVAAGPVGRDARAATDAQLQA